jgi:hypothetical protein
VYHGDLAKKPLPFWGHWGLFVIPWFLAACYWALTGKTEGDGGNAARFWCVNYASSWWGWISANDQPLLFPLIKGVLKVQEAHEAASMCAHCCDGCSAFWLKVYHRHTTNPLINFIFTVFIVPNSEVGVVLFSKGNSEALSLAYAEAAKESVHFLYIYFYSCTPLSLCCKYLHSFLEVCFYVGYRAFVMNH